MKENKTKDCGDFDLLTGGEKDGRKNQEKALGIREAAIFTRTHVGD